jgi:hypothetical protein
MLVLAGSRCSFDHASEDLEELSHIQVSNDVVRRVCDEEGKAIQKWMNNSAEPGKAFAAAQGVVEFSTDGLKINTVAGWREIRQSVFCKRQPLFAIQPPVGKLLGFESRGVRSPQRGVTPSYPGCLSPA